MKKSLQVPLNIASF